LQETPKFAYQASSDDLTTLIDNELPPSVEENKWIADSGATPHMTRNHWLLVKRQQISIKHKVRTGAGRLSIHDIGKVRLSDAHHSKIILQNVLCIPSLSANLVSIRVLYERGLRDMITNKGISFYRNQTLVLQLVIENNLYIVKWFGRSVEEYAYIL
jgi:hypothetical protein